MKLNEENKMNEHEKRLKDPCAGPVGPVGITGKRGPRGATGGTGIFLLIDNEDLQKKGQTKGKRGPRGD